MASSMLTGERRWVSARRGGMTVLGKVAVPKPVNLPSQRLENHGLDPNVEIVPKGTLSWGSRPSSTGNAWSSSALSPHANGTAGSLNGRPSSGGSGTRPSTAGSDRSHEPAANAWGPNSWPSSTSGMSATNQTSVTSLRPRSAETRPGSSQLSRFAESVAENSGAWGGPGTAERLGTASSRISEFTLSSGDFPTLGSEKSSELPSRQDHSSHGRPGSASSGAAPQKERPATSPTEDGSVDASEEKGNVNTWKRDTSPYHGGGTPPSMEKWQRDPQQAQPYHNQNMSPHHFDPWHGTPIRNPAEGVWYRGGPPGGPYGPTGPPGSYPLEPFGYYHSQLPARPMPNSQIPARPVPNSQVGPRPGGGPSGYHPKPGDTYRPRMPDSYNVPSYPVIPVRPGMYPGSVPYDGYYGPPRMSFCNPNERDGPAIGTGPPNVYRYPNQNVHPEPGNFHARPVGYGPSPAISKEQIEPGHAPDAHRGPYKVLLKPHDGWGENDTEEKREHSVTTSVPHSERGNPQRTPMRETDWGADSRKDEQMDFSKSALGEEASSQPINNLRGFSSVPDTGNPSDNRSKVNAVNESLMKKTETVANPAEGPQQFPAIKKDAALIDKIEGLNTKARISDGRNEVGPVSSQEEKTRRFRTVNVKADHSTHESGSNAASKEKLSTSGMLNTSSKNTVDDSTGDMRLEPTVGGRDVSRPVEPQASAVCMLDCSRVGEMAHSQIQTRVHGMQSRADNRGKGRFTNQEGEEWRKKPPGSESSVIVTATNANAHLDTCVQDCHASQEFPEKQESNPPDKGWRKKPPGSESSVIVTATNANAHLDTRVQDRHASQEFAEKQESNPPDKAGADPYTTSSVDSADYKAQRAKMKELATQRAKQLQKEEEERIREQRAKAMAKLEELNRRTLAENPTQKLEKNAVPHKPEEIQEPAAPKTDTGICGEAPGHASGWNSDAAIQASENAMKPKELAESPVNKPSEASSSCAPQVPAVTIDPSVLSQDANAKEIASEKTTSQLSDNGAQKPKQMGYKKKQNHVQEKHLPDKTATTGFAKVQGNVIVNANTSNAESSWPSNTNTTDDHPQQQHKKKNNRIAKNRHKPDEPLPLTDFPSSAPTEGYPAKASIQSGTPKSPETVAVGSSVQAEALSEVVKGLDSQDEVVVSAEQGWLRPIEETHGRADNQWKSQPHRRVSRNAQSSRPAEKFHGNEGAAIWAPVRPTNKGEPLEESGENINADSGHSSGKNVPGVQSNSMKGKRAEMERYVPKPVAKELSQQENSQLPLASSAQAIADVGMVKTEHGSQSTKSSGLDSLVFGKAGHAAEAKNVEVKHIKNGKTHASWRQRGPAESSVVLQSPRERLSSPCDASKTVQKPTDQQQISKIDVHGLKEQENYSDGWNMDPVPTGSIAAPVVVKDHGGAGRGKRQQSRVQRSTGHIHSPVDTKDTDVEPVGKSDNQPLTFGSVELDGRSNLRNENQGISEHVPSHWQPKSQVYSAHSRQGRGSSGGQRLAVQVSKSREKDFLHIPPQINKDISAQLQPHQSDAQKANVEMNNPHHQEVKREMKGPDSSKEHASFPNRGRPRSPEAALENVDAHYEQPVSTGIRRQGQHSGRFNRGQEAPYGGSRSGPPGQDANKQQLPTNGDRRKHGSHYEYQPVGSYNKPDNSFRQEELRDGLHGTGSRYRERGQNHPRRGGHFYGRNSGVTAAYATGD
ncbi:protein MODIFIER OF SNC1 1-like [Magnolia sinica]|uniref:protein MODIFIER OF SNC1 1-like n=1 Tax=Magnolia sinica TaxID=86752 RepID=UPI00265907CD|nr:protein MODIFIER OF SNC1 1-like [Magnolia sinica]